MYKKMLFALLFFILAVMASVCGEKTVNKEISAEVAPEEFVVTFLLSGARPIAVSYFWTKISDLREQRDYPALIPLYKILVKLEPRFANAWDFALYDMAVSIALSQRDLDRRFQWAKKGLLFGIEGASKTPHSGLVPCDISWILIHYHRSFPELAQMVESDPEINPERLPILILALKWVERAVSIKNHPILADWLIDFIYRELARNEATTEGKIFWLKKAIEFWKSLKTLRPDRSQFADESIKEIEQLITTSEEKK